MSVDTDIVRLYGDDRDQLAVALGEITGVQGRRPWTPEASMMQACTDEPRRVTWMLPRIPRTSRRIISVST
ncbi:hypothetical protein [Nocardia sp. NPDC004604]|uniref:hypothetical protein n=1 Tax=Nocardia sp. NPDC004604 TaxID=3157013 RepID=UPI0033A491B3